MFALLSIITGSNVITQFSFVPSLVSDFATAASRDLNDYVITERWRDVEQALTGTTHILPIWKAWGNARNEVSIQPPCAL